MTTTFPMVKENENADYIWCWCDRKEAPPGPPGSKVVTFKKGNIGEESRCDRCLNLYKHKGDEAELVWSYDIAIEWRDKQIQEYEEECNKLKNRIRELENEGR